jgi:excisionase family DNA binding protein
MEKLLLRPGEVADALGIGRSIAYRLLKSGEIPSVRVGRSVRVPAETLRAWLANKSQRSTQEASG